MERKRYKLGLAFSGGGVRGAVHLGILKVLMKNQIYPDIVAGTSVGSIAGALYAVGVDLDSFVEELSDKDIIEFLDPTMYILYFFMFFYYYYTKRPMVKWILPDGLFKGDKIEEYLNKVFHHKYFHELKVPLFTVSADINTGDTVVFCPRGKVPRRKILGTTYITDQKVATGVRSSISLPGILLPKKIKNYKLVDGGIKNNIPVDILYQQGANKVIAVDLGVTENRPKADSMMEVLMASLSIMGNELSKHIRKTYPAYYIFPDLQGIGYKDFSRIKEIVKYGEEIGERELINIKRYIQA